MNFGDSKRISSNAEWSHLERSPKGLAIFPSCCVIASACATSTHCLQSLAGPQNDRIAAIKISV